MDYPKAMQCESCGVRVMSGPMMSVDVERIPQHALPYGGVCEGPWIEDPQTIPPSSRPWDKRGPWAIRALRTCLIGVVNAAELGIALADDLLGETPETRRNR